MQMLLKIGAVLALCGIIAYVTWDSTPLHHEEEEEEHSHEFVEFSKDKIELHNIATSTASSGSLTQTIRAPARIVIGADNITHILPKAAGIAMSANKNLGEHVQAGEILATLDSKEMAEAKSSFLSSAKKEELTKKTLEREKTLQAKNISSAQELNDAETAWEGARIEAELAKQKLHALGLDEIQIAALTSAAPENLRTYEIRSPIDGQIISRHVTMGEVVTADQEVYVVADLSKVWAEINIFSQDRPLIKQGQTLTVTFAGSNQTADAKVIYLSPIIDPDTRTSTAIAEIDNTDGSWYPGAFAQATLVTNQIPVAMVVPREAVQNIDGNDAVFVAENNGFAVKPVAIGRSDDSRFEIVSGLTPGDIYASKNTFLLKAELQKDEAEHMD